MTVFLCTISCGARELERGATTPPGDKEAFVHLRELVLVAVHSNVDSNAHINEAPRGRIANVFQFCGVAQCQGFGVRGGAAAKQGPTVWCEAQRVLKVDQIKKALHYRLPGLCVGIG